MKLSALRMSMDKRIAEWAGVKWSMIQPGLVGSYSPSLNMTLWHGKGNLLAKIEGRGPHDVFLRDFLVKLIPIVRGGRGVLAIEDDGSRWVETSTAWAILQATPAQLAEALCEVIDENEEAS